MEQGDREIQFDAQCVVEERKSNMNTNVEFKVGRTVYGQVPVASEHERQLAIDAMRKAEAISSAIMWIARKIERLGERMFFRPSLKH
jgi:hypothetical protein